jgi:CRISPR-associated protein Csh1
MIESIYQLGKAVMEGSSGKRAFLESLAKAAPNTKKDNPAIAILKLDTKASTLNIEVREISESGANTVEKFLWLGNAASSASDQDRLTTDGLNYLVSQTLPNLAAVITVNTPLYNTLTTIISTLFIDVGEQNELGVSDSAITYRRSRKVLNLPILGIAGPTLDDAKQHVRDEKTAKGLPKLISAALTEHFKEQLSGDRILFTLEVDGELLVDDDEYLTYLENVYVGDIFEGTEIGRCHLTGKVTPVTSNLTRLKFKYYITDKLGFASGASSSGFKSNLTISKDAYIALLVGERFVEREMRFYLAGTNGYILPDVHQIEITTTILEEIRNIKKRTDVNLGIQESLDEIVAEEADEQSYSLNLLFYKRVQASFKVVRLIQDVPEYRLAELRLAGSRIKTFVGDILFGESNQWELTLQKMYYLFPVRKSGTDFHSRGVLEFYATLITGGLVDARQLVQEFMELVRVYRFSNYAAYHLSEPKGDSEDYQLIRYIAQSILLLAFLRSQNQLKEEIVSLTYLDNLNLNQKQKEYLEKLNYSQSQTALYLLGVLIGEIANSQYRLGSEGKGGKKTILNKLNYQGMTLNKVQQLAVDLFDKLRQYRDKQRRPLLNAQNEKIFAQAQALISEGASSWSLTPTENVYYILSGYSHSTFQAITSSPPSSDDDNANDTNFEGEQA